MIGWRYKDYNNERDLRFAQKPVCLPLPRPQP